MNMIIKRWLLSLCIIGLGVSTDSQVVLAEEIPKVHWNFNPFIFTRSYHLGFLDKSEVSGLLIKTLEGELQLGFDSADAHALNHKCIKDGEDEISRMKEVRNRVRGFTELHQKCSELVNPWFFSSLDYSLNEKFMELAGEPILIYSVGWRIVLFTNTHNIIRKAWMVDKEKELETLSMDVSDELPLSNLIHYGKGAVEGRIVKASVHNMIRRTYEVKIQVGPSGDNFTDMSVNSSKLYDYIIDVMATGRYLRIHYVELYGIEGWPMEYIRGYQTYFRIYKVEVIPEHPEG